MGSRLMHPPIGYPSRHRKTHQRGSRAPWRGFLRGDSVDSLDSDTVLRGDGQEIRQIVVVVNTTDYTYKSRVRDKPEILDQDMTATDIIDVLKRLQFEDRFR
jgi:hypothetical protein